MQWHTPIGYKVINGKITVYEDHRRLVEQIFRDYASGVSTLQIAKVFKEMGVKNAHDRVGWSHASIGRILENPRYLGTEDYPQIIDTELFERVQKRREQVRMEGSRGTYRPNKRERMLYGGMLICAECGGFYSHIQPKHKRDSYEVPMWKCKNYVYQNKASCDGFISDEQVEDVCIRAINALIMSPSLLNKYEEKGQLVSSVYRRLEQRLEAVEELETDEIMQLLFKRASERYKTLIIRDEEIITEDMREVLAGRKILEEFDEKLCKKLIKHIVVYRENYVRVIFINGVGIKVGYQKR